jgi:hypothetical protein
VPADSVRLREPLDRVLLRYLHIRRFTEAFPASTARSPSMPKYASASQRFPGAAARFGCKFQGLFAGDPRV